MPDINILISAKDNASGPINKVSGSVENLDKSAKSAAKGGIGAMTVAMGTLIGNIATSGITKLAELGASVITTGINFDNMKQQADIAFTTMLGSGEKAKAFLDDLQQFAAATPFEFPELLQASQRLLAMGFAAEDVKPTLTAIGDAVAALGGSGELVGRVTTALGQMQAKGKASAEEMNQLTEAGIPGWKFLAEAIGTDVAGAMKAVSKGAVDSETVIGAVVAGMNEDFGGMMEKQSHTWGGLLSTISDTFTQVSGTVLAPLFRMLTEGLSNIVEWTSKPEFTAGVQKFAEVLASIGESIRLLITGDFRGGIFGLAEDDPIIGALFAVRNGFIGTWETIQDVAGLIAMGIADLRVKWDEDWAGIRTTFTTFAEELPRLQQEFWAEWKKVFVAGSTQNKTDWEGAFGGISNFMVDWWRLVITNWTLSATLLSGEMQLWSNLFQGNWKEAWEGFKQAVFAATDIVLNYIEMVFGPGIRDAFATSLNFIWDTMAGYGKNVIGGFVEGIQSRWGELTDLAGRLANLFPSWMRDLLGIHSPSSVMFEIGQDTAEGFKLGVTKGLNWGGQDPFADALSAFNWGGQDPFASGTATGLNWGGNDPFADASHFGLIQAEDGSWVPKSFYEKPTATLNWGGNDPFADASTFGLIQAEDGSWVPKSFCEKASSALHAFNWGGNDPFAGATPGLNWGGNDPFAGITPLPSYNWGGSDPFAGATTTFGDIHVTVQTNGKVDEEMGRKVANGIQEELRRRGAG